MIKEIFEDCSQTIRDTIKISLFFVILISVIYVIFSYVTRVSCEQIAEVYEVPYKQHVLSGCYLKVNNKWIDSRVYARTVRIQHIMGK